jgi:hypothetical protein
LLSTLEARGQSQAPELYLGRIRVINRSVESSPTSENLFIVPYNYTFKINYKLEDNSRAEPFNTRASGELKAQYIFGRLGTAEDWYFDWRPSNKKENWNPTATYKVESSFTSSGTLPTDELVRRFAITLKAESGRSSRTRSQGFTLVRQPSRGDRLLVQAVIENEAAKAAYGLFFDNLRKFADGSAAQEQLQEAMTRLWHNAKLFIEHYDLYADPQGSWADVIVFVLSRRFPGIGELWMLIEYKNYAENLINDVNSSVSSAINMSTLAKGMQVAHDYVNSASCNADPLAATALARTALKAYGYDRSLGAAATTAQLDSAVSALDSYKACLAEARSRFSSEVDQWRDFSEALSDHEKVRQFGENLFNHHERYVTMHQVALAAVAAFLSPVCGDGRCFAGETCMSCSRDCCRPYDRCFASGEPTRSVTIDFRDDRVETQLYLRDDDFRELVKRPRPRIQFLWHLELVGRAFGTADTGQGGIVVSVNGSPICEFVPHQRFPEDGFATARACSVQVAELRYTSFEVTGPFKMGWNTVALSTNSHWTINGLRIGLDPEHDCDRSAWDNEWNTQLNPADDTGELMISHEISAR